MFRFVTRMIKVTDVPSFKISLKIFQKALVLGLLSLGTLRCTHLSRSSDERWVKNSILANHDRAPQSLSPDFSSEQQTRLEADAHFTLAESYSFQGESGKAIEEFKQTLLKDPESVVVRLRLAAEYARTGLISEAIEMAKQAVEKDPHHSEARMLLAGLYTGAKIYDAAIEQFEAAYAQDESNEEAALFIGAIYAEKGDFPKAENHFYRILKVPGFKSKAKAYAYLAKINYEKENSQLDQTVRLFEQSIQLDPNNQETVLSLAQIYMEEGFPKKAEKVLLHFQDEQGPDGETSRLLARLYLQAKNFSKASEQLQILSRFDPTNLSLKIQRALIHMELKETESAIALLKEILEESPELDKARFYLGALYLDQGQIDESIEQFEAIPSGSTYYKESRLQISQLYRETGRPVLAAKSLKASIEQRPDLPDLVAALAVIYDSQRKFKEAKEVLEVATSHFPENSQLHFFLGTIYDRLGAPKKSIEAFKVALRIDPDHVQSLNYMAYTYAELGQNLEEAEEMAHKALRLAPNDPYVLDTVGWVHFKKGNYKEAQKWIEAAYRQKPDEAIILEHLGDVYVKTESWNRASTMYQQAQILETDRNKVNSIREKLAAIENQSQPRGRMPASLPGD